MVYLNPNIKIISLNVYGINFPITRKRLSEWIQRQDPIVYTENV